MPQDFLKLCFYAIKVFHKIKDWARRSKKNFKFTRVPLRVGADKLIKD